MNIMTQDYAAERVKQLEYTCKIRPTSQLFADLAACYFTLGHSEQALPFIQKAWEKNKHPGIGMNLALILKDLGRHEEAFRAIEQAYWLNSDDDYIRLGYGEAMLKAGLWQSAWPIYDNARPTQLGAALHLALPREVKEWDGQPLPEGHVLLVINEGGTGDRFSYARWLPKLTEMGINWKFYPYDELFPFFERIFERDRLVADGEAVVPDPTHWVTTFSLPAKLNALPHTIPPPLPFEPSAEGIEKYKFTRNTGLPIIGLCYKAAERFQGGRTVRSLTEGQAMRLVCMTGDKVQWVGLQHGEKLPFPVSHVPFSTWDDTAALIHNLDGVVTVDTSIMHLAGAMNKKMATMLPGNSCWKFLKSGPKCIWYPSSTLFRTEGAGLEQSVTDLTAAIRNGFFSVSR